MHSCRVSRWIIPLLILSVALPASANRRPVLFSVLNDGIGTNSVPNDVSAISPDGAIIFQSAGNIGLYPDGTNISMITPVVLGLNDTDELDGLSWGADAVATPGAIQQGWPLEFYFAVDTAAIGLPGLWPPEVASEFPRAASDIYFGWPWPWPYGGNHLGVPEVILGLTPSIPDDLDAMTFLEFDQSEPYHPCYFSVDRTSCGVIGTGVWTECQSPAPPEQAADIFISFWNGNNYRFADEALMGLDGNDDNIDAFVLRDTGPGGQPNFKVDPGIDLIYFSVDWMTTGNPGTAVYTEVLGGNVQGDIFFSDFTGMNWKVLDGTQLGLLEPNPGIPFFPDEDNLNALETEIWSDIDFDDVPDIVDNCPDIPNRDQGDSNNNGLGDVCDPTGTDEGGAAPLGLILERPVPNPFRPSTVLSFSVPDGNEATLAVYDVRGRLVKSLGEGAFESGVHQVPWDGLNNSGSEVPPGIYFVKLQSEEDVTAVRVIRLK